MLQNAGIWGTASQCLNWANSSTNSQAWSINAGNSGFWDDPAPVKSSATVKQPATKQTATAKSSTSNQQQQQQQQPQQNSNNKASKSKNKREEELVKKLFEQNTAKPDDFTQWCNKTLSGIQASVDSKYNASSLSFTSIFYYTTCIRSPYIRWIPAGHRVSLRGERVRSRLPWRYQTEHRICQAILREAK